MSGYRFRLEAVLRVRRLQEEQARAALLRARQDESRAVEETRRRVGLLRLRARVTTPEGPSGAFLAERDRRERLAQAVLASRAAELHAVQAAGTKLSDWERAARDLATLERLDERGRGEFLAAVAAAEQRDLDEQATLRAARRDRDAAAARAAAGGEDGR